MLHKFLLSLTAVWAAHCVGSHNTAPSPSPFPFFSPMGRLLSSWPAHGEKRGKGEGDGALFLFAQNSLLRLFPHPNAFLSFFLSFFLRERLFLGGCCFCMCLPVCLCLSLSLSERERQRETERDRERQREADR